MAHLTENTSLARESDLEPRSRLPWLAAAGLSAAAYFVAHKLASRIRPLPVDLRGKVALITGGSRGLGLAIARELGESGCVLALVARTSGELDEAAEKLRSVGITAATFPCDITDKTAIEPLIQRVIAHFGHIDVLVNDAGAIKVAPLENMVHADYEDAMNLMFWAPVNLTLAMLPHFKERGQGHVVNIASVGGRVSVPHLLPYSCAKFALVGFSTGLSNELDVNKVHVLTVVPGLMRTGSYVNATFGGNAESEFAWFSLLGNLPGFSVSAEYAAREIRQALQKRQVTCTISLPAKLLIQAEALLPDALHTAMQMGMKLLPGAHDSNVGSVAGKHLNPKFGSLFQALTRLGKAAATSLNEQVSPR